jgi:uncharacterized membrane protein
MNAIPVFALAMGIGIVAGLRSFTAPAAVSWGAHAGRLDLQGSRLAFMSAPASVGIFSLLALAEFVADQLPQTPNRTVPGSLLVRIVTGGLSGSCLCVSSGNFAVAGALLGGTGGVIGAFAGYQVRTRLVRGLKVKDVMIAVPEDLLAIGLAYVVVFLR